MTQRPQLRTGLEQYFATNSAQNPAFSNDVFQAAKGLRLQQALARTNQPAGR